jgi:hypothetical protein
LRNASLLVVPVEGVDLLGGTGLKHVSFGFVVSFELTDKDCLKLINWFLLTLLRKKSVTTLIIIDHVIFSFMKEKITHCTFKPVNMNPFIHFKH